MKTYCIYEIKLEKQLSNLNVDLFYIGVHSYKNNIFPPFDGYKSSSKLLRGYIRKNGERVNGYFNDYGFDNFIWTIIETNLDKNSAFLKEKDYIKKYKELFGHGCLNIHPGGEGGSEKGRRHSKETKEWFTKIRTGNQWFNNGLIEKLSKTCPDGFVSGRLINKNPDPRKGKKLFNNGKIEILSYNCPDGFIKGSLNKEKYNSNKNGKNIWTEERRKRAKEQNLGEKNPMFGKKSYWSDHVITDKHRQKISKSKKGTHCYNNGVISVYRKTCPIGFTPGKLKSK